jgi:hypothetical protein
MAPRVHLILLIAALVLLAAAAAALVSGGHGARRHLAVADGDSEHRRLGIYRLLHAMRLSLSLVLQMMSELCLP